MPSHRLTAALLLLAAAATTARAASTAKVVAIADAAPGGGIFAGPSFTAWPSAAGNGWVAFRSRVVTDKKSTEAIILARLQAPVTRIEVARLGSSAPGGGTFRRFLGRPAVNSAGDVAFTAETTAPRDSDTASQATPAGVFLYRRQPADDQDQLLAVATTGQRTSLGLLDISASPEPLDDRDGVDLPQFGPSLNDRGDIAFLSAIQGRRDGGVLFLQGRTGPLVVILAPGAQTAIGTLFRIGPPVLNNVGQLAFHGTVTEQGGRDGIFRTSGGALRVLAQEGLQVPVPPDQPRADRQTLRDFGDILDIDDRGSVTFTGGPLRDPDALSGSGHPGALLYDARSDEVRLLAYPGAPLDDTGRVRVRSVTLGASGRFVAVPPAIAADGSLMLATSLTAGGNEGLYRIDLASKLQFTRIVMTAGVDAETSPAGGTFAGLEGGAVFDGVGGLVYLARVAGGTTPEALVYRGPTGVSTSIFVGEGSPTDGLFAGSPFSAPRINDAGDVVFRAYIARGPSSTAIVKARPGRADILAAAGDPSPLGEDLPFIDFPGIPDMNASGTVAFTAQVLDHGRGLYLIDALGTRLLVGRDDPVPGIARAQFGALGATPAINDAGQVAFRASYRVEDPQTGDESDREGVFLAHDGTIDLLVRGGDPSPASGLPFDEFRDPILTPDSRVIFQAVLSTLPNPLSALFGADTHRVSGIILPHHDLGGGLTLKAFSGSPVVDAVGRVSFLASRLEGTHDAGSAILRRTDQRIEEIVATGTTGPEGGRFRSFGQPTTNTGGDVAFLGAFQPDTGGTRGFFLRTSEGTLQQFVAVGDLTPVGGRFTSFDARSALSRGRVLAFTGDVSGGTASTGVFLASPTVLHVPELSIKLSGSRRGDSINLRLKLDPGVLSDGIELARDPIAVTIADAQGELWSQQVPGRSLRHRGNLMFLPRRARPARLKSLTLGTTASGAVQATVRANKLDLTQFGFRPLQPPLRVTFSVGDDSGRARLVCRLGSSGGSCSLP